jgi:hypothetical protein
MATIGDYFGCTSMNSLTPHNQPAPWICELHDKLGVLSVFELCETQLMATSEV